MLNGQIKVTTVIVVVIVIVFVAVVITANVNVVVVVIFLNSTDQKRFWFKDIKHHQNIHHLDYLTHRKLMQVYFHLYLHLSIVSPKYTYT